MSTLVTVDLETYYDREFSLSKIPTEQYIRDPRFETIGIAIKVNSEPTVWYPKPEVDAALKAIDWSDAIVVAQNTMFDAAILKWHYGVDPKAWVDIMGMSRALYPHERSHSLKAQAERMVVGVKGDEVVAALGKRFADFDDESLARYGAYCINDVDLTRELFDIYMYKGFPLKELRIIDLTLRMFVDAKLVLDAGRLREHLAEVRETKAALLESIVGIAGGTLEGARAYLMSNPKFADLLREQGVEPPMKTSPTTGKEALAFAKTDEGFKLLAEHENPKVQALVAARLGTKTTIEETRTERFLGMASRGAFPVPLRYYGAHSGRWSGVDSVNLQNLPSRGANAGKIKKAIKAPEGHVFIDCDSSQIEARLLAWLAGQDDLVEAFRNKEDVYKIMASRIYEVAVDQVDKQQRQVGKTVILGAGYGVGHVKLQAFLKLQAGVEVSLEEAKRIIDAYRATYDRIPELWKRGEEALHALFNGYEYLVDTQGVILAEPGKGLRLPSGLYIQYPNLERVMENEKPQWQYLSKGLPVKVYGGKCVENFTQAVARCVVAEQMLRISRRYAPVMTVHDSIGVIAPRDEADEAAAFVAECMSWQPAWAKGVPLACEWGVGDSYGDC